MTTGNKKLTATMRAALAYMANGGWGGLKWSTIVALEARGLIERPEWGPYRLTQAGIAAAAEVME